MPENTATPMARRISAPAPCEVTSGTTPMMNAIEVIRIGRNLSRQASSTACQTLSPCASRARDLLHRLLRLSGAVAGRRAAVHVRGRVAVVVRDSVGAGGLAYRDEAVDGNHVAALSAGLEAADILGAQAKAGLRLCVDLVGAAEAVEVIDVQGAQIHLHGVEEVLHIDAGGLELLAIHVDLNLRNIDLETREQPSQLRALPRLGQHILGLTIQLIGALIAAILDLQLEAADLAQPLNRRRWRPPTARDRGVLRRA